MQRWTVSPRGGSRPLRPGQLRDRLWGGFSRPAIRQLEILATRGETAEIRSDAAWALAEWHAYLGSHDRALTYIASSPAAAGEFEARRKQLLEAECLVRTGHSEDAKLLLRNIAAGREDPDLILAYANCFAADPDSDGMRLALINQVLTSAGFAPIVKADESAPLTIDNLTTAAAVRPGPPGPGPKVTVIMPAHNAAATIRMAVSGLLGQTWRNLEIIVVDDNSTDGTAEIAQELAASDPRVVAIRHDRNRGAFAARNSGLMHASGELITVHDCDDWSHPQKIETQVQLMIANPTLVGTRTYWARVSQGMHFFSWWRPGQSIIALNYSSFMFNRELLAALGGWDRVRVAGDSEFIFRAQSIFSKERLANLMPAAPLSFSLWEAD
jgi:hypothetical protein